MVRIEDVVEGEWAEWFLNQFTTILRETTGGGTSLRSKSTRPSGRTHVSQGLFVLMFELV